MQPYTVPRSCSDDGCTRPAQNTAAPRSRSSRGATADGDVDDLVCGAEQGAWRQRKETVLASWTWRLSSNVIVLGNIC